MNDRFQFDKSEGLRATELHVFPQLSYGKCSGYTLGLFYCMLHGSSHGPYIIHELFSVDCKWKIFTEWKEGKTIPFTLLVSNTYKGTLTTYVYRVYDTFSFVESMFRRKGLTSREDQS